MDISQALHCLHTGMMVCVVFFVFLFLLFCHNCSMLFCLVLIFTPCRNLYPKLKSQENHEGAS